MKSKNKYGAKKTRIERYGEVYEFPSKAEANHFLKLLERYRSCEIMDLSLQPRFILTDKFTINTNKTLSGRSSISSLAYTPDFKYIENGEKVVVEVKGDKTEAYQMRLKLFLADAHEKHGVDIFIEVVNGKETRYKCGSVKRVGSK